MKALTYRGRHDIRCEDVPDPAVTCPTDAVVHVTTAGICGSDLHIYGGNGFSPEVGYTPGHECVGVVVETGGQVTRFKPGDRVLVPASVGCTLCGTCAKGLTARCERAQAPTDLCYGVSPQLPGSQAQALAVPHADVNLVHLPEGISDEAAIVLTDNAPTAWYGCRRARIQPGETVLVIGLGPVGLMAAQSAFAMGAARVLGADLVAGRRAFAATLGVEPVEGEDARAAIRETTAGRGPDAVVEAVGSDATIELALKAVRQAGRVSVIGVSHSKAFPFHMGLAQIKELEFAIGLCSTHYELPALIPLAQAGRITPQAVVSHRFALSEGPEAYELFNSRADGVRKILLDPSR
ncbi:alcohol dehydrogenase catalytic domain-containing protein [Streptomyces luteolifulvus]|uniref:Alcohol dehydrogenase catalytic domain-containing protein n=1 Tax=Streptomyces luteolifulvus TaxID=2615112 RepID=A0A6H9UWC2_9ACTN|nr:alcohol dehydrogenase catalytic domain-containing protein [Streptomyces luteolifulvus]KAB1143427.1 alcohol dehydrogenase catalytic domain-containing protein [Streptomyces luteolifulvus]